MGKRHKEACHQRRYMNGKNTHEKNVSIPHTREMQIKAMLKYPYSPIRTAKITMTIWNGSQDAEKLYLSHVSGGKVRLYSHAGNSLTVSLKTKEKKKRALTTQPSNCTPGHFIPEK